jgi:tetratricopeptide (TPR) repeat protein
LTGVPAQSNEATLAAQRAIEAVRALDHATAENLANTILQTEPENPIAHAVLALVFEHRHDLPQAKAHARRALSANPNNNVARIVLAQVLLQERAFQEAEALAAPLALSSTSPLMDRAVAWNVIGAARDRLGDADAAFQAFTGSNQMMLLQHRNVRDQRHFAQPAIVRAITSHVARLDAASWKTTSLSTRAPVFLVAFPRSGTTLLDQVLSSHSRIVCREEKNYFWNALSELAQSEDIFVRMGELSDAEIEHARRAYWRRANEDGDDIGDRILIDRQPLHIVLLPLIKRVFPDAKIIFALRDPRDVVLSCYQQCFAMNVGMAQFLELGRAADYYDVVMSLFALCRQQLALDLHQVRYEDVVADLEGEARKLSAFLNITFEPNMLDYRKTALARDIRTPSMRQVIEPIYKRSVERWHRYAKHLAPVLPVLNAWAQRFGYEG